MFGTLPKFHGTAAMDLAEDLREITQRGESQKLGDLGHRKIGLSKEVFAFVYSSGDHVIDGGDPILPFESMRKIIFIYVCFLRQLFQCQGFFKMKVDIPPHRCALTVAGNNLGLCLYGQIGIAHKADNQDLHIRLADIHIPCVFQFHFPENVSKTRGNIHTFKMIQNTELSVGVFFGGQLNAIDTQNNILQRLCVQTGLRVGDVGVDNDQIVHIHGKNLILDEKLSFAADNKKQFCVIVCMRYGMPVTAVPGTGNI